MPSNPTPPGRPPQRIKRVGRNGQISIGKEHAGKLVRLEPHHAGAGFWVRFVSALDDQSLERLEELADGDVMESGEGEPEAFDDDDDLSWVSTREELRAVVEEGVTPDFVFFWKHTPPSEVVDQRALSQWAEHAFVVGGVRYDTAEHWMMAEKARLFGDEETRAKILAAGHPKDVKALGREVKGFDAARWERERFEVVVAGNRAKFGQNAELAAYLQSTGDKILVEASPLDAIWGIGLDEDAAEARDPRRWKGLNLLGFALMRVRSELT